MKKRFSMIAALLMQFTQLTVNSICEIRNQSTHHNKMLAVDMFKFVMSIRIAITVTRFYIGFVRFSLTLSSQANEIISCCFKNI